MMAKTRLSVAILAATLSLVGCIGDDTDINNAPDAIVGFDPVPLAGTPIVPFPFDAFFSGAKTPTLNIPNSSNVPFVAQANMQDGFSTTASWFIDVFGFLDMSTVGSHVVIYDNTGTRLQYGVDFTVQSSTVKDKADTADTVGVAIDKQRTRILIEPLKPLKPSATYLVGLTKGIKTVDGGGVAASAEFMILSSATEVSKQTAAYLAEFDATKKAQLEGLRSQLIYPAVQQFTKLGVTDLVLAYTVTTQSINKTLDMVAAETVAQPLVIAPTGKTPKDVNSALPANADIYIGTLKVPYYMATPANASVDNPTPTLNTYWKADAAKPDVSAKFLGKVPCGAYATAAKLPDGQTATPSASTTICFPSPVKQSDQTIPVLVTIPKTAKPAGGWPVVVFQHGITRNRSDMLAVAPALAQAGFVTIAIDLPLHGVSADTANPTNPMNLLYKNQAFTGTPAAALVTGERTFDVDFVNNTTGAAGPDGMADGSGTHFINLASVITSRDNLRQGAADIIVLAKSLAGLDIDGGGADIDLTKVRFVSQSLGSIVGTVALGIDKAKVMGAASLSVGGGGIPKLLDASKSYGPIIAGGLAASGVVEGTDSYETFMRFAQTLADSGDPINYAATAYTNHPIHLTEVMNDLVVPNKSIASPATATQDFVGISSFLSGTDPLAKTMGLVETNKKVVDMSTLAKSTATGSTWVFFKQGKHGSVLSPTHPKDEDRNAKGELDETTVATAEEKATFLAITTEMQCQTVNFVASNGAVLPIGCSKP